MGGIGAETASEDQQAIESTPTPEPETTENTATPEPTATATATSDDGAASNETTDRPNRTTSETEPNESAIDSDGDGLNDSYEREIGTDPTSADTDNDSLNDSLELRYDTDPTDADTDGDTLKDGWEVHNRVPNGTRLPGSDPLRKDIYVQVSYAGGSRTLEERQLNEIRGAFKQMAVSNPDGSTGISVHIRDNYNRVSITQEYSNRSEVRTAARNHTTREQMGDRAEVYHHVILMDLSEDAGFDVISMESDRIVVVDEDEMAARGGGIQYRARMVIWGLLRNVAGDVDAPYKGWWAQEIDNLWRHTFLPDPVIEKLEQDGFVNETADE